MNGFVVFIQAIQDSVNKILMVKWCPKSRKLIGLALDEGHVFSDGLGTLDDSLELVLDLFDTPRDGRAYVSTRVSHAS